MAHDLLVRIQSDLKTAMKGRDAVRTATLRMLLAAIKNREIELRGEVSEDELQTAVQRAIKQRRESERQFRDAGRNDLAEREAAEIVWLEPYLPTQVDQSTIRSAVAALIEAEGLAGLKDLGRVMGPTMQRFGGSADGATVQRVARELLGEG